MDTTILDKYGRMAFQKADFNTIILPAIFRHLNCSSAFSQHNFDAKMFQADYVKKVVKFLKRNEERFSKMADLTNGDFRFFFNQPNSADKILAKFPQQLAYEYIGDFLKAIGKERIFLFNFKIRKFFYQIILCSLII